MARIEIESDVTGTVWKIEVEEGASVTEGQTLIILESMKMEIPVLASDDGKVAEIMVDEADKAYLIEMRKKYKNILRNLWDPFDRKRERVIGCNTINRLYITPAGDVLPCPYVHIKIGNIYEHSLAEISEKGFRIRHFRDHSDKCLAGEDKDFVQNFMRKKPTTLFKPVTAEEVFAAEDWVS